jgi:hypothetical protein
MATQTTVDWLYEHLFLRLTHEQQKQFEGLFHQAKDTEREHIIQAANLPIEQRQVRAEFKNIGEQYYSDTYTLNSRETLDALDSSPNP